MEDIIFTRTGTKVTADRFPKEIGITPVLLEAADPELLKIRIEFSVEDGGAEYVVDRYDPERRCFIAHRSWIAGGIPG